MLTIGGFGGMVNASYGMNSMVHNTMWVTAHFHLIFGGTTVIMYFAIAYYLWPRITGREMSAGLANTQLWLWFIGILVLTIPWHLVGLLWMPRRTAWMPYDPEFVAQWQPSMTLMAVGGVILAVSALLFIVALLKGHVARAVAGITEGEWAEPVHPVLSVPRPLNGFALWNWILLVAMVVSFGYPLLQFFFIGTHNALPWGV
jgi:cytochrome c oxidase subunit 1